MHRVLAIVTAALAAFVAIAPHAAAEATAPDQAVARKLHDLGYPSDHAIAVQRWRTDTGRRASGPLTAEETAALLDHQTPEFMAAMVGNPFTGLGLALRHKTRAEAELDAVKLCRQQGGGATCVNPLVLRGEHCVAVVGYSVVLERRPTHRTSVAVSTDARLAMERAVEGCQTGATHPGLCKPLLKFCGDGRDVNLFDGREAPASAAAPTG